MSPAEEQGFALGITQSAGALARIFGPIFASATFDAHHRLPYLVCAGLALATGILTWVRIGSARYAPSAR